MNANPALVQQGPFAVANQRPPFALIGVVAGAVDGGPYGRARRAADGDRGTGPDARRATQRPPALRLDPRQVGQGCIHTRIDFDLYSRAGIDKFMAFIDRAADAGRG